MVIALFSHNNWGLCAVNANKVTKNRCCFWSPNYKMKNACYKTSHCQYVSTETIQKIAITSLYFTVLYKSKVIDMLRPKELSLPFVHLSSGQSIEWDTGTSFCQFYFLLLSSSRRDLIQLQETANKSPIRSTRMRERHERKFVSFPLALRRFVPLHFCVSALTRLYINTL